MNKKPWWYYVWLVVIVVLLAIFFGVAYKVGADSNSAVSIYNSPYQPASWTQNASEMNVAPTPGTIIYVARGESVDIPFTHPNGTCWFFQQAGGAYGPEYYNIPSTPDGNGSICEMTNAMGGTLPLGQYKVFYTFPSQLNGKLFKDVSWDGHSLVSIFGQNAPINEDGKSPASIMQDLETLIQKDGIDGIETSDMVLQTPNMWINRLEQTGVDQITLSGTTNLKDGDAIKILVDNGDFSQQPDAANFSYTAMVKRPNVVDTGVFTVDMRMPLQDMPEGWHEVTASALGITLTARFPIYETWKPEPTPTQYINYFSNGSTMPVTVTVTIPVVVKETVEEWHTATPTPSITDVLGNTINYPYSPGSTLPGELVIACMLGIAAIVLMRDYKRGR